MRTSTVPPLGPGTEPRTSIRFWSGDQLDDRQALLGRALAAHAAGAADALEHARRRRRGTDRARRALLCEPWDFGPDGEVVALDRAREALALARAGDLDGLADLERLDGHGVADLQLAGLVAELRRGSSTGGAFDLLEVAEQRLVERLLAHGAEPELDGLVAVGVMGADRR